MQSTPGSNSGTSAVRRIQLSSFTDESTGSELFVLNPIQLEGYTFCRFFYFSGTDSGQVRGNHAHRQCVQLLIPMEDGVQMHFFSRNGEEAVIPSLRGEAVLVPPMVWVKLKFLKESPALLVAATEGYSEKDYIRSESEFFY